jgi:hypothetical protein
LAVVDRQFFGRRVGSVHFVCDEAGQQSVAR